MSKQFAIIDIGTNAVKCKIFSDGQYFTPFNKYLTTSGYDNLKKEEVLQYLQEFATEASTHNVNIKNVYICATEGFRTSTNQEEIRTLVSEKMGRRIHIFSKKRENILSLLGAITEIPKDKRPTQNILYIESGGGSTEMSLADGSSKHLKIIATVSLPFGSKRLNTDKENKDFSNAVKEFSEQFKQKDFNIYRPTSCVINSTSAARIIAAQYNPPYFNPKTTMLKQARMNMSRFRVELDNILNNINNGDFSTQKYWLKDQDFEGFKNHCCIFQRLLFELQAQKFPLKNISVTTSIGGVKDGACYIAENTDYNQIETKVFGQKQNLSRS